MDPTQRWRSLLARPASEVPLDEAALVISAHAHGDVDVDVELRRLDRLAAEVRGGTDDLIELLFVRLGLTGAVEDYDHPDHSFLDRVLDRGVGLPIALSVLMIEVGRRAGLVLDGVGLPGHFVVRDRAQPHLLIDAHGGGRRLDERACRDLVRAVLGPSAVLRRAMLAPVDTPAILARMLANLDRSYRSRSDAGALTWVSRLRVAIPGQPIPVLVEAAATLAEHGRYDEAADVAEALLAGGADEPAIRQMARSWRARLN